MWQKKGRALADPAWFYDWREHPEEIVVANKRGPAATFERLSDRPEVKEILREGSLGDIWYSGILGGVPEDG